jgi:hypothetical protein
MQTIADIPITGIPIIINIDIIIFVVVDGTSQKAALARTARL